MQEANSRASIWPIALTAAAWSSRRFLQRLAIGRPAINYGRVGIFR